MAVTYSLFIFTVMTEILFVFCIQNITSNTENFVKAVKKLYKIMDNSFNSLFDSNGKGGRNGDRNGYRS